MFRGCFATAGFYGTKKKQGQVPAVVRVDPGLAVPIVAVRSHGDHAVVLGEPGELAAVHHVLRSLVAAVEQELADFVQLLNIF